MVLMVKSSKCVMNSSLTFIIIFLTCLYSLIMSQSPGKTSHLVPIPKKSAFSVLNDLRPVALTSIPMKILERLVLSRLRPQILDHEDPLQFAYREKRSVEDAILFFVDSMYRHLDSPGNFARVLFVDFSSAFNTILPHILVDKMCGCGINYNLTKWVLDFLTNRTQRVFVNGIVSSDIVMNTGAPQGCVLSPVLFTLYTSDCRSTQPNTHIVKFADDTCILGLIKKNGDETGYRHEISTFTNWCDENRLQLNVSKTKELVVDFRRRGHRLERIEIRNEPVEQVHSYKYLGVSITEKLEWGEHVNTVLAKTNQRMFFLRKLSLFRLDASLISLFYNAAIETIITFCLAAWGGNTTARDMAKMNTLVRKARRVCRSDDLRSVDELLIG
ncbi:hypothetical protein BSL78_21628 [Apostichopus japonicus]|uniref:Reverse transcriptase domain-containing protein n=1 Tax=Stichopus japonicus TaxID=307972 RepID=A0A2G8K0P5_STIJA|nr:hypothetical protein BSL78_21628 [Apostichopus japonicus]